MSRKFLTPIDHAALESLNRRVQNVASLPTGLGSSDAGRECFLTSNSRYYVWSGSAWLSTADAADTLGGANDAAAHAGSWYQDRTHHTGTQTASTISDLSTTVHAYTLDSFAAPTAAVALNSQRITGVADPTSAQDAATRNYVDTSLSSVTSGMTLKGAVVCAPVTNISLSTPGSTIDGVTMSNPSTILLTGQTTASANGPYVWTGASTALTRAGNWDTTGEATLGSFWIVEQGTNADTFAVLTNDTAVTLGTTDLTFTFRGAAGATYSNGNGLNLSGTTFSVKPDSGISVTSSGVAVDSTVVRKVSGMVPATTSGIFSVSGAVVTINHGLNNYAARLTVRYGTSPQSGNTQGYPLEVEEYASDANNIVVTFPAAPAANQYAYLITA